jgi:hypothetical protein
MNDNLKPTAKTAKRDRAMLRICEQVAQRSVLNEAYEQINALGGTCGPGTDQRYWEGYDEALGDALRIIERLGGKDPLTRAPAPAPAPARVRTEEPQS